MRLISEPEFLVSVRLNHPTISLQLRGDPTYDRLIERLEKGRRRSVFSRVGHSALGYMAYVTGASNAQSPSQEDMRFLNSPANGPDEQPIVDEIKRAAAEILYRRVEESINSLVRTSKPELTMRAKKESDRETTENVQRKHLKAWNILRAKLTEELHQLSSVPGAS